MKKTSLQLKVKPDIGNIYKYKLIHCAPVGPQLKRELLFLHNL